jgi:hypothetical protein
MEITWGKLARKAAAADLQASDLEPFVTGFLKHRSEKHRSITEKLSVMFFVYQYSGRRFL